MGLFSPDQIAMLAAALAQGAVDEPAPVQQPRAAPRRSAAQYNKEPEPASLGISLLAAAADEMDERPAQRASRGPLNNAAQPTADSLDEIANHILSTFPEFAELLQQTRLTQPAPQQQQPQHRQELDPLQQLMLGITQQAEQEQALQQQRQQQQQLALQLQQQQEQLAMQQKQEEQVRLHLQRQQQLKQQQQQQMQQQKQLQALQQQQQQALQQQQELELLLLQHQQQAALGQQAAAAAAAAAAAEVGLPGSLAMPQSQPGLTFNKRAQPNASNLFNVLGGTALGAAAAGGAGSSSFSEGGPSLNNPWGISSSSGRKGKSGATAGTNQGVHPGAQLPPHLAGSIGADGAGEESSAVQDAAAAAAAISEAMAAAAAVAAAGAADTAMQDVQQQQEQEQLMQQRQQRQEENEQAGQEEEEQWQSQQRQPQQQKQQKQQKKKAARARRPRGSDPDTSMSSAPTTDSNADSVGGGDEDMHPAARAAAAAAGGPEHAQPHAELEKDDEDDADDEETDDDDDDADAAAQAASAVPMSRRAMLGLPPVGLSRQQQRMAAAHAAMHQPVLKTKPPKNKHAVFVWDLDESLVLLHSLINGKYASSSGGLVDAEHVAELGRKMQALVMKLIDDKLFFKQLEDVDVVHLQDVWRLAAQYKERVSRKERQQQQLEQSKQDGTAAASSSGSQEQQQQQQDKRGSDQQQEDAITSAAAAAAAAARDGSDSGGAAKAAAGGDDAMEVDEQAATGAEQPAEQSPAAQLDKLHAVQPQSSSEEGSERDSSPALANGTAAASADEVLPFNPNCAVAGSRSVAPEPELVLRPFKLGPKPDVLKELWEEIQKVYDNGSGVLPLPKADVAAAELLWEDLDAACSGWLTAERKLLHELTHTPDLLVSHVLVANSQLVPLLGKLMLFKLDTSFALSNVYSASTAAKMACFKRIAAKYGPKARYIVLGDGLEEESCAEMMEWPFVRITLTPQPDLPQPVQPVQANGTVKQPAAAAVVAGMPAAAKRRRVVGGDDDNEGDDDADNDYTDADNDDQEGGDDHAAKGDAAAAAAEAAAPPEAAADGSKDGDTAMQTAAAAAAGGGGGGGGAAAALASVEGAAADKEGGAGQIQQQATKSGRRIQADALNSAGHTLLDLTAQQLLKLALSCS